MEHIVLIDGHHMLYRAYWAIPRTLKTSKGEQVNTVFGLGSMLLSILQQEQPDALVFCFDEGDQTFRHQEHAGYKDGRAETPDDFYIQIPRAFELIDAFGIHRISDPRYEADDFLAAYACAADARGMRVTIVSGDRDLLQIVTDTIRVAVPHKGYQQTEYLDVAGVEKKLGVRPDQIPAFKGLAGDSSDNLPGVRGIGPKTAAVLLQDWQTLDGIYAHLDVLSPVLAGKLVADKEQAYFCQRMALLDRNIQLPIALEDLACGNLPSQHVLDFLRSMEFSLLVKRFTELLRGSASACFDVLPATNMEASVQKDAPSPHQQSLF